MSEPPGHRTAARGPDAGAYPGSEPSGTPGLRLELPASPWALAGLCVAALVPVALLAWTPAAPGVWHDDGVYLLLAKALAQGEGLRYAGVAEAPPGAKFPPLFPGLLALVWKVAPAFPHSTPWFQAFNLTLLLAGAGAFVWYAYTLLELPGALVAGVVLAAWTLPDLWSLAVIPLSEPAFLLFLVAAAAAAVSLERKPRPTSLATFTAALALAFHTRTMGVVVAVAAVASLAAARRLRWSFVAGGAAALVMVPWLAWSGAASRAIAPPLRDILGGYGGWLTAQALSDPGAYAAELGRGVLWSGRELGALTVPLVPYRWAWLPAILLLPLLARGARELWRRSRTAVLLPAAYLVVVWLWPFAARRLLMPVVPWLLLLTAVGGWAWTREAGAGTRRSRVGLLALGLWLGVMGVEGWSGIAAGDHDRAYRTRSRGLVVAAEWVRTLTPPDAVVGAPELWPALHLYTGRTVAPSAGFRVVGRETPIWGAPRDQYRIWLEAGVDHLLVEYGGSVHGPALDAVDAACPGGAVALLAQGDAGFLVRLELDPGCRSALGLENSSGG